MKIRVPWPSRSVKKVQPLSAGEKGGVVSFKLATPPHHLLLQKLQPEKPFCVGYTKRRKFFKKVVPTSITDYIKRYNQKK